MQLDSIVFIGTINGENELLFNARKLFELMKVSSDFSTWMSSRIKTYKLKENIDYFKFSSTDVANHNLSIFLEPEDLKKYVPASQKINDRRLFTDYMVTKKTAEILASSRKSIEGKDTLELIQSFTFNDSLQIFSTKDTKMNSDLKSNENSQAVKNPDAFVPVFKGVFNGEEQLLCNARELHEHLQVGRVFANWIKGRIEEYGFVEDQDYILISTQTGEKSVEAQEGIVAQMGKKSGKGRPSKEYYLTLDMAKELAMVEKTEVGRQVRKYFIQCESQIYKRVKSQTTDIQKKLDDDCFDPTSWNNTLFNSIHTLVWAYKLRHLLWNYKSVLDEYGMNKYGMSEYCVFLNYDCDMKNLFKHQYRVLRYYAERLKDEEQATKCIKLLGLIETYYDKLQYSYK